MSLCFARRYTLNSHTGTCGKSLKGKTVHKDEEHDVQKKETPVSLVLEAESIYLQ